MDYKGQQLSEFFFYYITIIFGGLGWIVGYIHQDFSYVFYPWLAGVILSTILCVPDWPFYNRHPIKWIESVPERRRQQQKKAT
mmetsp:Transcript_28118/g.40258  ORF Transcript_28118/g.40258 Transcript_28118/m.40258 type:complete len:83 (+) Transcript_28118:61-309(+)